MPEVVGVPRKPAIPPPRLGPQPLTLASYPFTISVFSLRQPRIPDLFLGVRWDAVRDGMGWMGLEGMRWIGWDGKDRTGWQGWAGKDGKGQDGVRWDGMGEMG